MYKKLTKIFVFALLLTHLIIEAETKSIAILVDKGWIGERAFALRIKSACENLDWKATILNSNSSLASFQKFNWILTLTPNTFHFKKKSNYLVLFDPENHYFRSKNYLKSIFSNYYGYITTYTDHGSIRTFRKKNRLRIYPNPWYPTAQYRPFAEVSPRFLFYFIGQWGNRCHDLKYKILQELLANQNYTQFFGNPVHGQLHKDAYKGSIPFTSESVQEQIFDCGVCLVLHSDIHINHEIPSGRIFEAAAAGAVIISDMNPFVKKYFGDSVLYVDHTKSGNEMFAEIDAHMRWILDHEEEAKQLAIRSYEIFTNQFLLEQQLLEFDSWHQSHSKK